MTKPKIKTSDLLIKPAKRRVSGSFKPASKQQAARCNHRCESGTCMVINA